ncbi:MAG: rubredoxin [Desulfobacterales bacterium]|jgi:rubredoxin
MSKHECPCEYIYDSIEGDPEHWVDPGTPFDKLPDEWLCPKCGSEKEFFEETD